MGTNATNKMGCGASSSGPVSKQAPETLEEKAGALFDMFDNNNSGYLEHAECVQLCRGTMKMSQADAEAQVTVEGFKDLMAKLPGGGIDISKAQMIWGYQNMPEMFGTLEADSKKAAGKRGVPVQRQIISEDDKALRKIAKKLAMAAAKEAAGEVWDAVSEEIDLEPEDLLEWDWAGDLVDLLEDCA